MTPFDSAWAIVKMPMYYHATPAENLDSILREGIRSNFGEVYASLDPEIARRWISMTRRESPEVSVIPFWRDEGDPRMRQGADHSPMMLAMLGFDPNEVGQQASWTSSEPIPPQDIWPDAMANERSPGVLTYPNPMYVEGMAEMMEKVRQMQMEHINSQDEDGEVEKADRDPFGFADGALQLIGQPWGARFAGNPAFKDEFRLVDTEGEKPETVGRFYVDTVRPDLPTQVSNNLTWRQNEGSMAWNSLLNRMRHGQHTGQQHAYGIFSEPFTNQPIPILHGDIDRAYQKRGIYTRGVIPTLAQHYGKIGSNRESRSHAADIAHRKMQITNHPDSHEVMNQGMSANDLAAFVGVGRLPAIWEEFDVADFNAEKLGEWTENYEAQARGGKLDVYNNLEGEQIPLTFSQEGVKDILSLLG